MNVLRFILDFFILNLNNSPALFPINDVPVQLKSTFYYF